MSCNGVFEKSPTERSFKWSVLIMKIGESIRFTGNNFRTFIVFDLRKRFAKWFTV